MARLGTLNLRFNLFSGNLPQQPFLDLRKFLYCVFMCSYANVILKPSHQGKLDTSVNFFAGGIPTTLGLSAKLVELDLSQNDPAGPIPSELGLLTNLSEYLSLDHVPLYFYILTFFCRGTHFDRLRLDGRYSFGAVCSFRYTRYVFGPSRARLFTAQLIEL